MNTQKEVICQNSQMRKRRIYLAITAVLLLLLAIVAISILNIAIEKTVSDMKNMCFSIECPNLPVQNRQKW